VIPQYDFKGGGKNFVDAECKSEKGDDGVMRNLEVILGMFDCS
jgi:hypothetical protein